MTASGPEKRRTRVGRKEGAQPANTNALKHGIYSRHFTPEEHLALDRDVAGSLKDEAEILRLATVGAADIFLARPESDTTLSENVFALRTVSISIARLISITLTRLSEFGDPDRREQEVDAMLALMVKEEHEHGQLGQAGFVNNGNGLHDLASSKQQPPHLRRGETCLAHDVLPPSTKKKRGGQLGNSNAVTHGFYARDFTAAEKALLNAEDLDHLHGEESVLHVLIARTWRSLRSVLPNGINSQEYLFTVRCLTYAAYVVEKIQRVRRRLFGDSTELEKDIQQGLDEARKALGINNFLDPEKKDEPGLP